MFLDDVFQILPSDGPGTAIVAMNGIVAEENKTKL